MRKIDPIFARPSTSKWINMDSRFYAPEKAIFKRVFDTYWVNIFVIWSMTITITILLYFDILKKVVDGISNFKANRTYKLKEKEEKEN